MENSAADRIKAYISEHIREPITAADIARAAGYSQYHAARVFREAAGITPFEYIRRERLLAAAHTLRGGKLRVLDVALDYVFDSHEGFTRAFTRAFGIAPKRFAAVPRPDGWLIPYRVLTQKQTQTEKPDMNEKTAVIFTQIVERPARRLLLFRSKSADNYFDYCAETGCGESGNSAPWDWFVTVKEALGEPVGLWLPDNMRHKGTGIYAHGVEVPADWRGAVPEGFDTIDLPPCKMLVFQGEPYDDEHFEGAIGALWERIESFNPAVYGYEYAPEAAPRMQLSPQGWRGYIEMRPVKQAHS
ncbi:MAG: AraC family transcriptional regulator [Oscillospiraceae bacterium]|jgi:AraC-like DNA-binding protein|nr:AraC family transcriptional regulator [Oscillospiraceae bacterium]